MRTEGYFLWQLLGKRFAFIRHLVALVVDEVHVEWGYRHCHGTYGNIGDLHAHIRKVPVVSLSVTVTATVLNYTHKALHLSTLTVLYRLLVERSNVTIVVPLQAPKAWWIIPSMYPR